MVCQLRKWRMEDAADLAAVIANPKILENLRDGIPTPIRRRMVGSLLQPCCLLMNRICSRLPLPCRIG